MSYHSEEEIDRSFQLMWKAERKTISTLHEEAEKIAPRTTPSFESFKSGIGPSVVYSDIYQDDFVRTPDFELFKRTVFYAFLEQLDDRIETGFFRSNTVKTHWKNLLDIAGKYNWGKGVEKENAASYLPDPDAVLVCRMSEAIAENIKSEFVALANESSLSGALVDVVKKLPYHISTGFCDPEEIETVYVHELTHRYVWEKVGKPVGEVDEAFAQITSGYLKEGRGFNTYPMELIKYKKKGLNPKKMATIMMLTRVKIGHKFDNEGDFSVVDWLREKEVEIIQKDISTVEGFLQEFIPERYSKLEELDYVAESELESVFESLEPTIKSINEGELLAEADIPVERVSNDFRRAHDYLQNSERKVFEAAIQEYMESRKINDDMALRRTFNKMMDDMLEKEIENLFSLRQDFLKISELLESKGRDEQAGLFRQAVNKIDQLENKIEKTS